MRLLLDSHIPPVVARELRRRSVDTIALRDWRDGDYRNAADEDILSTAFAEDRVFVSYDCHTIPPVLTEWAETGKHHAGVILVDENTVRPNDVGRLLRALYNLVTQSGDVNWEDRTIFLRAR